MPERPLRTVKQLQDDPTITNEAGYRVVEDARRAEWEHKGYTFVEDLAGAMCLIRKEPPKEEPPPVAAVAPPPAPAPEKEPESAKAPDPKEGIGRFLRKQGKRG